MNILISGGCKNGKSYRAQRLAKDMAEEKGLPLYYLATMIPHDDEDLARIARHRKERENWGFTTLEQGENLPEVLNREDVDPAGVFLLDATTALLGNEMFRDDGTIDSDAPQRVAEELCDFAKKTGNTVFVSDYIYSEPYGEEFGYSHTVEDYRRGLAAIDRRLAAECDKVWEVAYGTVEEWK